jgi:hypothetical protein
VDGLISFSGESAEKPAKTKYCSKQRESVFGNENKVNEKRKKQSWEEQASLFCSRFFVL